MDYCAGAGGKSLAFGSLLKGKGQLFLYDEREAALIKAKKRFSKAGINNVQFHKELAVLNKFKGKMDWLVLDVPCTGKTIKMGFYYKEFLRGKYDKQYC